MAVASLVAVVSPCGLLINLVPPSHLDLHFNRDLDSAVGQCTPQSNPDMVSCSGDPFGLWQFADEQLFPSDDEWPLALDAVFELAAFNRKLFGAPGRPMKGQHVATVGGEALADYVKPCESHVNQLCSLWTRLCPGSNLDKISPH